MKKGLKKVSKIMLWSFGGLVVGLLIAALVLYISTIGDYSVADTVTEDASIPHVKIDGVIFHAEAFGDPALPVAIVLHGGPGNDYRSLLSLKALSDEYRVVFYDQRGTGLSPRVPDSQLTAANMLEDVGRIVAHFGHGEKVRLIGHSWGAMLASGYTAEHPDHVSHLLLAEPGMLTAEAAMHFREKFQFDMGATGLLAIARLWFTSRHVDAKDDSAQDDYFFTHVGELQVEGNPMAGYFCNKEIPQMKRYAWRYNLASSIAIQSAAFADTNNIVVDFVSGIENYQGKVIFLAGACNTIIGESFQQEHHLKYFKNATIEIINETGHAMFTERPDAAIAVTRRFLAQ